MLNRLEKALGAARSASLDPAPEPRRIEASRAIVAFDPDALMAALPRHALLSAQSGLRGLVLSDRLPARLMDWPMFVFEFLPLDVAAGSSPDPHAARDYLIRRTGHILQFWNVVTCDWTGPRACQVLSDIAPHAPHVARVSHAQPDVQQVEA